MQSLICKKLKLFFRNNYLEIAELYSHKEEYDNAIKFYKLSLESKETEAALIHLGESYLYNDQLDEAKSVLTRIIYENVSETIKLEFLETQALLSIKENNRQLAKDVVSKLEELTFFERYFVRRRDQICKELKERFKEN